jgi:hypothetical protein
MQILVSIISHSSTLAICSFAIRNASKSIIPVPPSLGAHRDNKQLSSTPNSTECFLLCKWPKSSKSVANTESKKDYPLYSYRVHNMTDRKISTVRSDRDSLANLGLPHEFRDSETSLTGLKAGSSKVVEARTSRSDVSVTSNSVHEVKDVFDRVTIAAGAEGGVIVERVDLDTAKMGILAVLVVLEDLHLNNPSDEGVAVRTTASAGDGNLLPAGGVLKSHGSELDEVILASAGLEDDLSRGVGLILVVVNVEADVANTNTLGEVHGELMGLRAIRPEMC